MNKVIICALLTVPLPSFGVEVFRAIMDRNYDAVKEYLESGGSLTVTNDSGNNLLAVAADYGDIDIARILVEKGVELNPEKGSLPLDRALAQNQTDMAAYLISKGANPNQMEKWSGETLLFRHVAGYPAAFALLASSKGIDINTRDKDGNNLLHSAARYGYGQNIPYLLKNKVDINARDNYGATPLMIAARNGKEYAVSFFLQAGADFNAKNSRGETALMFAAESRNNDVFRLLLEKGASLTDVNIYGENVGFSILGGQSIQALNLYTKYKGDPNAKDFEGRSLLHRAATAVDLGAVSYLVSNGAAVNVQDNAGYTPIYLALREGLTDNAEILFKAGTDINIPDKSGATPLHAVLSTRYSAAARWLIEKGAKVNVADRYDTTPLHIAAEYANVELIKYLLSKGADKNALNYYRENPFRIAEKMGRRHILPLLK